MPVILPVVLLTWQDVVIGEEDCGTLRGIATTALKDNEDIIEPLSDRIEGRNSLVIMFIIQLTDELIILAGEEISADISQAN